MAHADRQSGYILLPVVLAITLVAAIAFLMNHENALNLKTLNNNFEAAQADYIAQAGMAHATWGVQNSGCVGDMTMTTVPLGQGSYSATVDAGGPTTTTYSFTPNRDTWIKEASPDENNAGGSLLSVKIKSGDSFRALYHYDLSSIPSSEKVVTATAWFYLNQNDNQGAVTLHPITADWTESDATWNTMGSNFDNSVYGSIPPQPASGVWIPVNLTALAQAWVNNSSTNFGILLNATVSDLESRFTSKESGASQRPYLKVTTADGDVSPVQISATGTTAGGVTRTLTRNAVNAYQPPNTLNLQPGTEGTDAEIWDQAPNNNYGDAAETWVSSASNDTTRSLLRFNMDAIPAGARILGATLSLERQSGSGAGQPVSAHRIMNPWSEDSVTWNRRETGTNWDTAGGDFDNRAVATTPVGPANQRYEWNITPLVQGWVDGSYPNYGVALVAAIAGMPGERFYTSDHADPSKWPSLSITYACACGQPCIAAQGAGKIIFVVSNPWAMTDGETAKKSLFEGWGYTVTLMSQWDVDWAFDAAAPLNDVVYASEAVDSTAWGLAPKLAATSLGVINEEGELNDELGMASSFASPVGSAINVTDNSHYITLPFPSGALDIYSAAMEGLTVSGTEASGLQTLADWGGAGALVVLNQGAQLYGGGTAAGRRVMLPLGREAKSNLNYLNNNGQLIVQRALQWGTGNTVSVPVGELLLVVDDAANLTTEDTAKKALIESWNYSVVPISDDESQTNIDTALASADVVYITESVVSGTVGTKFTGTTIGVLNEEGDLNDELGMSSDNITYWTSDLTITDNSHYITKTFSTGTLSIVNSSQRMNVLSATMAPGLQNLAISGSNSALDILVSGGTLWGGGSAAGRRVKLPWATGTEFDVNALNANGQTLLQRAIEWGTGTGCGSLKPLLLVVSDAVSPSSQETARQALMESWCYGVTLIDDDDGGGDYDAAVALNDVVYISQEITSNNPGNRLKDASIGIVNEEYLIGDDLGLAAGTGSGFYNDMNVVDNTHYITSGFGLGALALFDPTYDIYTGAGFTLAPDLQVLGEAGSMSVLVALDTGGALYGGGAAAGRRVQVAWGDDFSALNSDGQTLMQRAIEWAGGGGGVTGPIAHWKADDGTGGTATDSEGGHHGTLTNGPSWDTGVIDGGLSFDGSNDYIDVPHDDTLSLSGGMTFTAWGNTLDTSGAYKAILAKDTPGNGRSNYWFGIWNDELVFGFWAENGFREVKTSSSNLQSGTWYHLAASFDNAADVVRLYVDGTEVHVGAITYEPTTETADLWIAHSPDGEYWDGRLDDIRIYDRVLDATEIADLDAAGGGGGGGTQYVEANDLWWPGSNDTWETVDLASYGVPSDAVVEIAVMNNSGNKENWAGVRAVDSSLERRLLLHEAEGGGNDVVVMHVQADASSRIQTYADDKNSIVFILLGYWTGASYVERFDAFQAGADASWQGHDLGAYGLGPNQVAEITISNTSTSIEWLVGARQSGSSLARRIKLHEAEGGGVDVVTMQVETDASSMVEVYAQANSVVDFHVIGYWSTPPGTYTETGGVHGQAVTADAWHQADPSLWGVPPNSVAQFLISNEVNNFERELGIRQVGSDKHRVINLQEAEAGGADTASFHVNIDANTRFEIYSQADTTDRYFYPLGWWVLQ